MANVLKSSKRTPAVAALCEGNSINSTVRIECLNLTMRMSIRRFTRLTNFCRPHASLGGKTPVQAAGVDSRRWSISDLVGLLENPKD